MKPLLNRVQCAEILNCGLRTFDRLVASRKFPRPDRRLNGRLPRWTSQTIENWLRTRKEHGGS